MTKHPYPDISSIDDLNALPADVFLEVAGNLKMLPVRPGEDPVAVAREYRAEHPQYTRFRIVRMQRFSIPVDAEWPPVPTTGDVQVWPTTP